MSETDRGKPILIAKHPGDLALILKTALKALESRPPQERVEAIAETANEALEMWLGLRPIPRDGVDG